MLAMGSSSDSAKSNMSVMSLYAMRWCRKFDRDAKECGEHFSVPQAARQIFFQVPWEKKKE